MDKRDIDNLLEIMASLRDPHAGCPWDLQQSFETIAPYTVEEAYEVADAIARQDLGELRGELGDLLFQVVFHARMAEERGVFDFGDVVDGICEKLRRRHPHVFGTEEERSRGAVEGSWERIKEEERRAAQDGATSVLDGVALSLPALKRAGKLGKRAASVGFDWPNSAGVVDKIAEEADELAEAVESENSAGVEEELGDMLFSLVNLSRHLGLDAEIALEKANRKFEGRFRLMEEHLSRAGLSLGSLALDEMEQAWQEAKIRYAEPAERSPPSDSHS